MTRLPPSPFLSCSGEFPSFSPVDAAASIKPPLRDAAAEIPGALVAPGPAAVPFAVPPVTAAGDIEYTRTGSRERLQSQPGINQSLPEGTPGEGATNSAWVRDCDRIELHDIPASTGGPQRALPAVATDPHETGGALVFVLDEAAFMEAIEANPLNAREVDSISHRAVCDISQSPDHGEG